MNYFTLDDKGRPQYEPSEEKWDAWRKDADRSVARSIIGEFQISTLFTGVGLGDESTAIWQTQILEGELDGKTFDCHGTRKEALNQHDDIVKFVREFIRGKTETEN